MASRYRLTARAPSPPSLVLALAGHPPGSPLRLTSPDFDLRLHFFAALFGLLGTLASSHVRLRLAAFRAYFSRSCSTFAIFRASRKGASAARFGQFGLNFTRMLRTPPFTTLLIQMAGRFDRINMTLVCQRETRVNENPLEADGLVGSILPGGLRFEAVRANVFVVCFLKHTRVWNFVIRHQSSYRLSTKESCRKQNQNSHCAHLETLQTKFQIRTSPWRWQLPLLHSSHATF